MSILQCELRSERIQRAARCRAAHVQW